VLFNVFFCLSGAVRTQRSEMMTDHHHKHETHGHAASGKPMTPTKAAVASGHGDPNTEAVCAEDIRVCAYHKWEKSGKPTGDGLQFWLTAEQELRQRT
jgi:hypothetical protein